MDAEEHRQFLRELESRSLWDHLRMYQRNGMMAEAARTDIELRRRREDDEETRT